MTHTTETTDIPSTRDELNRKAVDLLLLNEAQLNGGAIDKRTAYVTAKTVWTLTAGLVDEDISSVAAQQADAQGVQSIRRHFVGKGKLLRLAFNTHTDGFFLLEIDTNTGERLVKLRSVAQVGEREALIAQTAQNLIGRGFIEI